MFHVPCLGLLAGGTLIDDQTGEGGAVLSFEMTLGVNAMPYFLVCVQVLSGETFHIFDPCGRYLLSDPSKEVIVDNNEGGEDNSEPASMTSIRPSLGRPSSPNEAETEEVGDVELSPEDREVASLTTAPQRAVKNPASANLPPQALARR